VGAAKMKLGNIPVEDSTDAVTRMAMLLWGPSSVGKSTFAATAPGHKLWLSFGDNEHISVMHRKDVSFVRLYNLSATELFQQGQCDNPFGLDELLAKEEKILTVVADSATALSFRALQRAIGKGVGKSNTFTPSIEQPGISAYGGRNGIVLEIVTGLMKVTAKHNVHFIITAHEADADTKKDEKGNDVIDYISVMLGGQLVNNMSLRLSEIWYMSQGFNDDRRIAVRPTRNRRPMKSRMFSYKGEKEFLLNYDADLPDKGQMTIAGLYEDWERGGFKKLQVPKGKGK
jgi:hypothetical protein